jgi:hypothetical protein
MTSERSSSGKVASDVELALDWKAQFIDKEWK